MVEGEEYSVGEVWTACLLLVFVVSFFLYCSAVLVVDGPFAVGEFCVEFVLTCQLGGYSYGGEFLFEGEPHFADGGVVFVGLGGFAAEVDGLDGQVHVGEYVGESSSYAGVVYFYAGEVGEGAAYGFYALC